MIIREGRGVGASVLVVVAVTDDTGAVELSAFRRVGYLEEGDGG